MTMKALEDGMSYSKSWKDDSQSADLHTQCPLHSVSKMMLLYLSSGFSLCD